jgi:cytochrome b subunit of formate dehydrogenase
VSQPEPELEPLAAGEEHLVRHLLPDRVYHWSMAVAVLTLLATGFLPVLGVKFAWVMPHWIAGLVLVPLVLFHIARAVFWLDLGAMAIGGADFRAAAGSLKWVLRRTSATPPKPGKYPLPQKLYHHFVAVILLLAIGTGLVMMIKIDTPFWQRDPYFLSDSTWGIVYVLHGLTALCMITLIMVHVYFALRPEKLWFTRSMLRGWITRRQFLDYHDPTRWQIVPDRFDAAGRDRQASIARERNN